MERSLPASVPDGSGNGDITTNDIPVLIVLKGPAGEALLLEELLNEVPDEQKDYGAYEGADNLAIPF